MSKEIQNLKRSDCNQNCQRCNILNIAQRRIGNRGYTRDLNYLGVALTVSRERCPDNKEMELRLINPAKNKSERKNHLW